MELSVVGRRGPCRALAIGTLAAAVLSAACRDREALAPQAPRAPSTYAAVAVACEVEPASGTASCGAPTAPSYATSTAAAARSAALAAPAGPPRVDESGRTGAPRAADAIIGGQGSRLDVQLWLEYFAADPRVANVRVNVRNLLSQSLGTTNGSVGDSGGIKLIFDAGPTVIAPTSYVPQPPDTARVDNAGIGTFTGGRPQWWVPMSAWGSFLRPGATASAGINLRFPAGATRMAFRLLVVAAVPDESDAGLTPDARGWEQVAAGEAHACGIRFGGAIYCWGDDVAGQLGDGGGVGLAWLSYSQTRAMAVGDGFQCRVSTAFELTCFGVNTTGQLFFGGGGVSPDGTFGQTATQGVRNVAAGRWHACAVMGTTAPTGVQCAGSTARLQFEAAGAPTPLPSGWLPDTLVAGVDFTCGLRLSDGSARCWGRNDFGQVRTEPGDDVPSSGAPPIPLSGIVGITAGDAFACALLSDGSVWCWGDRRAGQLGACAGSICRVLEADASRTRIAAGAEHACAASGSTVTCWGNDDGDQLGGPMSGNATLRVTTLSDSVRALALGRAHTCAGLASTTKCWGDRRLGALGMDAVAGGTQGPASATVLQGTSATTARDNRTCALTGPDAWTCWGALRWDAARSAVFGVDGSARYFRVAAGRHHTCALRSDDSTAVCWGEGGLGALGTGDEADHGSPGPVAGGRKYVEIAAGDRFTCALEAESDDLFCWGDNRSGQLAIGSSGGFVTVPTPAQYSPPLNGPAVLYAGAAHACVKSEARGQPGSLWCWGRNRTGQLGRGDTTDYPAVPGNPVRSNVLDAALGNRHTCIVSSAMQDGASADASCTGANDKGQLGGAGVGARVTSFAIVPTPGGVNDGTWGSFASVAAGAVHTCASTTSGSLWCWGADGSGRLFDIAPTDRPSLPRRGYVDIGTALLSGSPFSDLMCYAKRTAAAPFCWGSDNRAGVFGSSRGYFSPSPTNLPIP